MNTIWQLTVIPMILNHRFNLYISSCAGDGGIYHYQTDGNGEVALKGIYGIDRPMYISIRGNKLRCLLRAPFSDSNESGLVSYDIKPDGSLSGQTEPQSTKGVVACHLTETREGVYCANYLSGSVIKMPDTVDVHSGCGINPKRQEAPHTHFVAESPDGRYIFATDLGIDKIFVYNKDLTVASTADIPSGHGPRHLAFHGDGKHVFCVNELTSTVSVLEYGDGRLALTETVASLPGGFSGENTAAAIRCIGDEIFVSQRGHDSVSTLKFADGHLTLCGSTPCGGKGPRDFWADDEIFICTNEVSDNVTFIRRDTGEIIYDFSVKSPISVIAAEM